MGIKKRAKIEPKIILAMKKLLIVVFQYIILFCSFFVILSDIRFISLTIKFLNSQLFQLITHWKLFLIINIFKANYKFLFMQYFHISFHSRVISIFYNLLINSQLNFQRLLFNFVPYYTFHSHRLSFKLYFIYVCINIFQFIFYFNY